jgi:hypothetical protein
MDTETALGVTTASIVLVLTFYIGGTIGYTQRSDALTRCAAHKMTIQQCAEINGWKLGE